MRRVLRSTMLLGGVAVMTSSMASQSMADRFTLQDGCLNGDCVQGVGRAGHLPAPLTPASLNLQTTQTAPILAGDGKSNRGGALVISSFNSGGGSTDGRRYTIPPASHLSAAAAVPESATLLLLGTGLVSLAALLRKRLRARANRAELSN